MASLEGGGDFRIISCLKFLSSDFGIMPNLPWLHQGVRLSFYRCGSTVFLLFLLSACGGAGSGGGQPPVMTNSTALWQPKITDTFNVQLRGILDTTVPANIYVVDLFDTPASQIASLKQQGRRIVCYFSAGTSENWRPDYSLFQPADIGVAVANWPGENFLDTRSANVRNIMQARLNLARSHGCDGVDPDNVNGYTYTTGFSLTAATQLNYNQFLAYQAHLVGLSVGLKNDTNQLNDLVSQFDFAINEQCHEFSSCAGYQVFTSAGKAVLNIEYLSAYVNNTGGAFTTLCAAAQASQMRTLVLPLLLDGSFRLSCG